MTTRRKIGLGASAVVAAGLVLAYVFWWSVPTVRVASPTRGPAVQAVCATGAVEPVYWAQVSSTVVGRIVEIKFRDNDTVKKGDVLEGQKKSILAGRADAEAGAFVDDTEVLRVAKKYSGK